MDCSGFVGQNMLLLFSIVLAAILIGSAYIITEKNAKYNLSGYWNLKPADREKVDLKGYLKHWKKCMWITGVLILITGTILNFTTESPAAIFPLLAIAILSFPILIVSSRRYWK